MCADHQSSSVLSIVTHIDTVNFRVVTDELLVVADSIGRRVPVLLRPCELDQMAVALIFLRTSDLLSAFVGGSEEQIQAAFHLAQVHEAVLFLDEADGLLASRDGATRNWEVTQVNELLVQLHDFEGVVVLATNRMDYLDEAVLRRMDAKVEMLPLRPEQAQTLLLHCLRDIYGQDKSTDFALSPQQKSQLQRLYPLTPGDFAMLQRRLRFAPVHGETAEGICTELLQLLEQEVRLKSGSKASIGFVPGTSYRDVHATPKALS